MLNIPSHFTYTWILVSWRCLYLNCHIATRNKNIIQLKLYVFLCAFKGVDTFYGFKFKKKYWRGECTFEWVKGCMGKWKTKQPKGWVIKNLLSFPKHDSLKYWRLKSNANSHMLIQYVNQSEPPSWSFFDLSGGKWCLQRKYMCRDKMKM
jgi:hypothetical protein